MSLRANKLDLCITTKEQFNGTCTLDDSIIISISSNKQIKSDIGKCYCLGNKVFNDIISRLDLKNSLSLKGYSVVPLNSNILKNIYIILDRIKEQNLVSTKEKRDITFEHKMDTLKNCILRIKPNELIYAFIY